MELGTWDNFSCFAEDWDKKHFNPRFTAKSDHRFEPYDIDNKLLDDDKLQIVGELNSSEYLDLLISQRFGDIAPFQSQDIKSGILKALQIHGNTKVQENILHSSQFQFSVSKILDLVFDESSYSQIAQSIDDFFQSIDYPIPPILKDDRLAKARSLTKTIQQELVPVSNIQRPVDLHHAPSATQQIIEAEDQNLQISLFARIVDITKSLVSLKDTSARKAQQIIIAELQSNKGFLEICKTWSPRAYEYITNFDAQHPSSQLQATQAINNLLQQHRREIAIPKAFSEAEIGKVTSKQYLQRCIDQRLPYLYDDQKKNLIQAILQKLNLKPNEKIVSHILADPEGDPDNISIRWYLDRIFLIQKLADNDRQILTKLEGTKNMKRHPLGDLNELRAVIALASIVNKQQKSSGERSPLWFRQTESGIKKGKKGKEYQFIDKWDLSGVDLFISKQVGDTLNFIPISVKSRQSTIHKLKNSILRSNTLVLDDGLQKTISLLESIIEKNRVDIQAKDLELPDRDSVQEEGQLFVRNYIFNQGRAIAYNTMFQAQPYSTQLEQIEDNYRFKQSYQHLTRLIEGDPKLKHLSQTDKEILENKIINNLGLDYYDHINNTRGFSETKQRDMIKVLDLIFCEDHQVLQKTLANDNNTKVKALVQSLHSDNLIQLRDLIDTARKQPVMQPLEEDKTIYFPTNE